MIEAYWPQTLLTVALAIAVAIDLRSHRIPNWLTFGLLALALIGSLMVGAWPGLLISLGGATVGLLCFLPLHIFGAMGAGDVKLMAAAGAVLGPQGAVIGALATVVFGGFLALAFIGSHGGLAALWHRYRHMALMLAHRQPVYLAPAPGEAASKRFPYALAIACGSIFSLWYLA